MLYAIEVESAGFIWHFMKYKPSDDNSRDTIHAIDISRIKKKKKKSKIVTSTKTFCASAIAFLRRSKWRGSYTLTRNGSSHKESNGGGFSLFRPWCFRPVRLKRARRTRGGSPVLSTDYRGSTSRMDYNCVSLCTPLRPTSSEMPVRNARRYLPRQILLLWNLLLRAIFHRDALAASEREFRLAVLQKRGRKRNALVYNYFRDFQFAATIQLACLLISERCFIFSRQTIFFCENCQNFIWRFARSKLKKGKKKKKRDTFIQLVCSSNCFRSCPLFFPLHSQLFAKYTARYISSRGVFSFRDRRR